MILEKAKEYFPTKKRIFSGNLQKKPERFLKNYPGSGMKKIKSEDENNMRTGCTKREMDFKGRNSNDMEEELEAEISGEKLISEAKK